MPSLLRSGVALAVLTIGCSEVAADAGGGGGAGPAVGGGTGDAGGTPVASELAIEVVDERGLPGAGLDVLSHTETGALAARATTTADGTAVIEVPAGGIVSVLFDRHNPLLDNEQRTVQSVRPPPGLEALRFSTYESQPDDQARPPMGSIVIDFGPLEPDENLFVIASCARELELSSQGENQLAVEGYRGCPDSDVFDIYAYRVLLDDPGIVVTGTAAITGQPFLPGESAELVIDWQPASLAETVWHLSATAEATTAFESAWWLVEQPYVFVREVATQAPFDPLVGTFSQKTTTLPAERHCVSLGLEQDAGVCTTSQRTVCDNMAPADITWSLGRLAVPMLSASTEDWTLSDGELGDFFEIRTVFATTDGAFVLWSQAVATEVSTRATNLELPDDLEARFGRADDAPTGAFVVNVDVEGVDGFDAVLTTHGAFATLPGGLTLTRETVFQRPCPD